MKIRLLPYNMKSASARALAEELGVLRVTQQQRRKHGDFDVIINWGSRAPKEFTGEYINRPEAVALASDKRAAFAKWADEGVPSPPWTVHYAEALEWWEAGLCVVARTLVHANQGRGIVLASRESGTRVPPSPLYTQYVKKADEYRVHCCAGKVISVQQKRKRRAIDNEDVDYQIRNARNGWVFCRDGVDAPDSVLRASVLAVDSLGLDFGGVDVGYNRRADAPTVYEVNTAPGLEGTTLERYRSALQQMVPQLRGPVYAARRGR